jgi:hypothetical protein
MRPEKTAWGGGWQEFGPWPTAEVLAPLNIEPDNLGVVARLDSQDDTSSGPVAPVIVYSGSFGTNRAEYMVHLLPPETLAKVDYEVANLDARKRIARGELCKDVPGHSKPCIAGNMPFAITFDLSGQPSGNYRLMIDTRVYEQTVGPSHEYFFWHEARR